MNIAQQLQALITKHHNPERKQDPMVYQVWQDGEVTLQKGGDLLWQRNLHCVEMGAYGYQIEGVEWPEHSGKNFFIYTDKEGAETIHKFILDVKRGDIK